MLATGVEGVPAGPMQAGAGENLADQSAPVFFTVPTPPSTNALFKNVPGKGRVRTGKYDDYIRHAVTAIRSQRVLPVHGNVLAIFGVERPNAASDLDNRLKGLLDAIVKAGVLDDDRFVTGLAVSWLPPANGTAHVILMPVQRTCIEFHPARNGASGTWIAPSTQTGEDDGNLAIIFEEGPSDTSPAPAHLWPGEDREDHARK